MLGSPSQACAPLDSEPSVRVVVCSSCRSADQTDDTPRAGALLAKAVRQAAEGSGIAVSQVPCLANCKRSLSAAILRPGAWTYVFGDLGQASAPDLVVGAKLLQAAADGLLPWRGRPESLKRGMIARVPPHASLEEVPS